MNEEKAIEEKECKCFCKSEGFRNFLITALGTFVGVYMALSLFTSIHKPPMPCPCHFMNPMQMHGQFGCHKGFHKINKNFNREFKEDANKVKTPEADD